MDLGLGFGVSGRFLAEGEGFGFEVFSLRFGL